MLITSGSPWQSVFALGPVVTKIYGYAPAGEPGGEFGESLAMNDKWLVVGEPSHDAAQPDVGAVHVFNAQTGKLHRRILSPFANANTRFGTSVALSGNRVLVGAYYHARLIDAVTGKLTAELNPQTLGISSFYGTACAISNNVAVVGDAGGAILGAPPQSGYVALFDPKTGEFLRYLTAPDAATFDSFGWSVATDGRLVAVGSRFASVGGFSCGAVYVFDAFTGALVRKVSPSDAANGDEFGRSVALGRDRLVVGTSKFSDSKGGVYVYHLLTGAESKWLPADAATDDYFGQHVSVSNGRVLIGASGKTLAAPYSGAAYLYELETGKQLMRLEPSEGAEDDLFGTVVCLDGEVAAVGVPRDSDAGPDRGAVYLFRQLVPPLPLKSVATQKAFSPGIIGGAFARLDQAAINSDGEILFSSTVSGAPSSKNQGLWSTLSAGNPVVLRSKKGDAWGNATVAGLSKPMVNHASLGLFQAALTGPGVNAGNNQALIACDDMNVFQILRTGDAVTAFGGGKPSRMLQVLQSNSAPTLAVTVKLASGTGGITPSDDSGLLQLSHAGGTTASAQEGDAAPMGGSFGEFNRFSLAASQPVFAAGLMGVTGKSQGLFTQAAGVNSLIARQGDPAPGAGGAEFGTFLGEASSFMNLPVFRCTLKGTGVTNANRDSLWHKTVTANPPVLVARAGDAVPGMASGVKWKRFVQFASLTKLAVGELALFVADITGPGINATNDRGLWLLLENGDLRLLLREGDGIGDNSGATIRNFNRIAVHPIGGTYTILATLANCPASKNLALFTGSALQGTVAQAALRAPLLRLRKGQTFQGTNGTSAKLTSLSFPAPAADPTGSLGKGLAQVINGFGHTLVKATFSDRSVQLMSGIP